MHTLRGTMHVQTLKHPRRRAAYNAILGAHAALTAPCSNLIQSKPWSSIVKAWHAGTELVKLTIAEMIKGQCEEVVLEAEVTNSGALALYQNLGFIRDKRLHRYQRCLSGIVMPLTTHLSIMMVVCMTRQLTLYNVAYSNTGCTNEQ